ncbi:hypothetical protein [Acinetobacter bereziniae]|uniref:hypothetical protein n=1 Tax=Acinetobacter bereziniae TaxID=106648 RepID=UPI003AF98D88
MSNTSFNFLTDYFVTQLENSSIDLLDTDISVRLVATNHSKNGNNLLTKYDYDVNKLSEDFLLSDKLLLENKKILPNGVFDADDCKFLKPLKDNLNCKIIAIIGIEEKTQKIIFVIQNANGLPCYINGGNIKITWDNCSNRIFQDDLLIPPVRQE